MWDGTMEIFILAADLKFIRLLPWVSKSVIACHVVLREHYNGCLRWSVFLTRRYSCLVLVSRIQWVSP